MPAHPHRSRGFTLIELMLVLALLVVIGALSVAVLDGTVIRARLDEGADMVGSAWTDARTKSISAGTRVVFTCQIGGSEYRIAPCNDLAQTEDQMAVGSETGQLPEGVVFKAVQSAQRDTVAAGATTAEPAMNGDWGSPIVFDPDGTSYDAVVVLESESGRQVELTLRGLTGTSTTRGLPDRERVP